MLGEYRDGLPRKNLCTQIDASMEEDEEMNVLDISIHNLSVAS